MSNEQSQSNKEAIVDANIIAERPTTTTAQSRSVTGWIASLLAVVALIGVGWSWQQSQMAGRQTQAVLDAWQARLPTLLMREDLVSLESSVAELQADKDALNAAQATLQNELEGQRKALEDMHALRREDWRLAEAEYLLRLANQNVLMGRETRGAQALLRAADDILREQDNPRWHPVRAAIAADLAALRAAGRFDTQGVYLQLTALEAGIAGLQLVERGMRGYDVVAMEDDGSDAPAWWIWVTGLFDRYVLVRRSTEPVEPLLAPREESALRMNLQLLIEQAKLALLAHEQVIYVDALTAARGMVSHYFRADTPANNEFAEQLRLLAGLDINPLIPDISGSLNRLREQMALTEAMPSVDERAPGAGQ